jgi:hypothetical protein
MSRDGFGVGVLGDVAKLVAIFVIFGLIWWGF